jgi:hypothetical protein
MGMYPPTKPAQEVRITELLPDFFKSNGKNRKI